MTTLTDLHPVSRDATVSVSVLRGLVEAVERAGHSAAELLRAAQLQREQLDIADARLPLALVYQLCERAIDLTADDALGLHWAERVSEGTFVPISPLLAHSASLRQALEALTRFSGLLSDQTSYRIIEQGDLITIQCMYPSADSVRVQRFASEMLVAGFYRLLCFFSIGARPDFVSFQYAPPSYADEYERVFDGMQRFAQPFTGIVFDRALMDLTAPRKDAEVHGVLHELADRRLLRLTQRMPYALRVREQLLRLNPAQRTDMSTVARLLGLSVRSLRRRLDEEGKSYNEVVNEALATAAKHLLHDKQRTIQETAFELGFSDSSTFHRAFRSWTGVTPSEYRNTKR